MSRRPKAYWRGTKVSVITFWVEVEARKESEDEEEEDPRLAAV